MDIDLFVMLLGPWPSGLIDLLSDVLGSRVKLKRDDSFPSRAWQDNDLSAALPAVEAAIRVSSYVRQAPKTESTSLHHINRRLRMDGVMAVEVENCMVEGAGEQSFGVALRHRPSGQRYRFEGKWDASKLELWRAIDLHAGPPPAESPIAEAAKETNREITATAHRLDGTSVGRVNDGEPHLIRFRVGPPVAENLASGDTTIRDVPAGGLNTRWVVTSDNIEFLPERSQGEVRKIAGTNTWRAQFDLHIPEAGESETRELAIKGASTGSLLVTIDLLSDDKSRETHREIVVRLDGPPRVSFDQVVKAPGQANLRTLHEWTTPPEHIRVRIAHGTAEVDSKAFRLKLREFEEPFTATDILLHNAILNVRDSLEKLRDLSGDYFEDLDHEDMQTRLASSAWHPYPSKDGWAPLPDGADQHHKDAFEAIRKSKQWNDLANDGYALFDRCFPEGTEIRKTLNELPPGSRIDFDWTPQSGPGYVSHVPWALMHMKPADVTGQLPADPEDFLGLRFRIGSRSWNVKNPSVLLGGRDVAQRINLLYWGRNAGDDVGEEAKWQAEEYVRWGPPSAVLPDLSAANPKQQLVLALDSPAPSPVGVIYFYCHCSVGDGNQPVLRFGSSAKRDDTLGRNDLSHRTLLDAPLVFANACTTAQSDPHMTSELEQAFFERGIRAFIGTETKVPTKLASKFAWLFFQFFYRYADQEPISAGEALAQARMFLWTQYRNIGGLFYSISNQYDLYLASMEELPKLRK